LAATCSWPDVNINTRLGAGEVHVWCVQLNISDKHLLYFQRSLAPDESRRASRFHFERDRKRYIAKHGLLREILGNYLSIHPAEVQFAYNPHGKPFLLNDLQAQNLNFNISSSGDLALFVFLRGRQVGVDIEKIRQNIEFEELVERFFSENERKAFQLVKPKSKLQTFFCIWARKEAYIKAQGQGLSVPISRFDVFIDPHNKAEIFVADREAMEKDCWSLRDLDPALGYAAALAVQGKDWKLQCWRAAPEIFMA
jgi:4'-phosphopantetheinyl transferase